MWAHLLKHVRDFVVYAEANVCMWHAVRVLCFRRCMLILYYVLSHNDNA